MVEITKTISRDKIFYPRPRSTQPWLGSGPRINNRLGWTRLSRPEAVSEWERSYCHRHHLNESMEIPCLWLESNWSLALHLHIAQPSFCSLGFIAIFPLNCIKRWRELFVTELAASCWHDHVICRAENDPSVFTNRRFQPWEGPYPWLWKPMYRSRL